jgi:hypothetical protein
MYNFIYISATKLYAFQVQVKRQAHEDCLQLSDDVTPSQNCIILKLESGLFMTGIKHLTKMLLYQTVCWKKKSSKYFTKKKTHVLST